MSLPQSLNFSILLLLISPEFIVITESLLHQVYVLETAELPVETQYFTNLPLIENNAVCIQNCLKLVFTRRQDLSLNPVLPPDHSNQQCTALLESSPKMATAEAELLQASPHQDLIGKHLTRELPVLSWYVLN